MSILNRYLQNFAIVLFILAKTLFCISFKNQVSHLIKIRLDFSNLSKNREKKIRPLLEESRDILSQLIYINKVRKLKFDKASLKLRCKHNLKFEEPEGENYKEDMVIFIISENVNYGKNKHFEAEICRRENKKYSFKNIALFKVTNKFFQKKIKSKITRKVIKLEILRTLTDSLGLVVENMQNIRQPKNNYFSTPIYLLQNSTSYKSLLKLYKLLDKPLPKRTISKNGNFFIQYWDSYSIIKDFRRRIIEPNYDISEISINLLNDMDFYTINKCDFNYDVYNKCHRFDKKCIKDMDNYFLYYTYMRNKVYCYLSSSENLKNDQCGNIYGKMITNILNYTPFILKDEFPKIRIGKYEIPEIDNYKTQILNMLTTSPKCQAKFPRTIFLESETRKANISEVNLTELVLNKENKKYFVTYQADRFKHYKYAPFDFLRILRDNGFIRSYVPIGNENFIIDELDDGTLSDREGNYSINKYQKVSFLFNKSVLGDKGDIDVLYKKMKKKYPKDYNFMFETYIYPEERKIIKRKFRKYKLNETNLWLVKPRGGSLGIGIYFYGTKEKKLKNCVLSKYLSNPHLLHGKKYDLRIYVLVTGLNPFRLYLYKEGLVRISSENYTLNLSTINQSYIHLTNTALNKNNKNYIFPENSYSEEANKWNLKIYKNYLKNHNISYYKIRRSIADITIKTFIMSHHIMLKQLLKSTVKDRSLFRVFGLDIIIDNNYQAHLIEVNTRPDMKIYDKMDTIIKQNLFVDTLNIVGITPFSHDEKQQPYDKDFEYKNSIDEAIDYAFCEMERPRGDFELIFPKKENINKYSKFFARRTETNKKFWEKIKNKDKDKNKK